MGCKEKLNTLLISKIQFDWNISITLSHLLKYPSNQWDKLYLSPASTVALFNYSTLNTLLALSMLCLSETAIAANNISKLLDFPFCRGIGAS